MKDKLNKFMENVKKQNPNANWTNLLTGVAVLVMVAVFSYAYFTKSKSTSTELDLGVALDEVTRQDNGSTIPVADTATDNTTDASAQSGEKGGSVSMDTTTVQKGEGLWQIAQRVCGDGEKYNILANANGLSVWEGLVEGMALKVVCK